MWGPKGLKGMLLVSFLIPAPLLAQGDGTKVGVIDVQELLSKVVFRRLIQAAA